jgi:hypothetical protein
MFVDEEADWECLMTRGEDDRCRDRAHGPGSEMNLKQTDAARDERRAVGSSRRR